MSLILQRGTERVSREGLLAIATPPPTSSWKPVPHYDAASIVAHEAEQRGHIIESEEYGISAGGEKMFGVMKFHPDGHPEMSRALGIRNSHDKSLALGLVAGVQVLVCSNLCFGGAVSVYRKHTSGIDLEILISDGFNRIEDKLLDLDRGITVLKAAVISNSDARLIILQAAELRAIPSCDILPVLQEFERPRHEEFSAPVKWSLYNAFTEVAKKYSPPRAALCHKVLGGIFGLG